MIKILSIILFFTLSFSQIQYGGQPKYSIEIDEINFLNTNGLNIINNDLHPMVFKYGNEYLTNINILEQATKLISKNETTFYFAVESKNAKAISFVFDKISLTKNTEMFIYNEDKSMFIGSFNSKNNNPNEDMATALVKGDKIIIELTVPNNEIYKLKLNLYSVIHDFRDLMNFYDNDSSNRNDCNDNVACSTADGWEDQIDSVVLITSSGGSCSAALVNNTAYDLTPYILYAAHCNSGGSSTVYFNYQSNSCNGNNSGNYDTMSGTQNLAIGNFNNNDYALIRLNNNIPSSYNPYFSGWNRSTSSPGNNVVGIHHPDGDIKKISYDAYGMYSSGNEWVFAYGEGRVIPGSSGSPFFDSSKRIRGMASYIMTNYCYSYNCYCNQTYNHGYAKFSSAWTYIDDYLDPIGSGATSIDGTRDGSGGYEITLISPNGGESILAGTSFNIDWEDNIPENVSLKLYKAGYFVENITTSTTSDGSYNWSIPNSIESGVDYKIKITSLTNTSLYDYSNSYFAITAPLGEIDLYIGNVDTYNNTIDIMISNPDNVSGYQFNITDYPNHIDITNAYGGVTENEEFLISTAPNGTVIAFSLLGSFIQSGTSLLTQIEYSINENCNNCNSSTICLEDPIVSNQGGLPYPINIGNCQEINLISMLPGDINNDTLINILDVVSLVNEVINPGNFTDTQFIAADLNNDSILNILDVVSLVNIVLDNI